MTKDYYGDQHTEHVLIYGDDRYGIDALPKHWLGTPHPLGVAAGCDSRCGFAYSYVDAEQAAFFRHWNMDLDIHQPNSHEAEIRVDDVDLREEVVFQVAEKAEQKVLTRMRADHKLWRDGIIPEEFDETAERARLTELPPPVRN